MAIDFHALGLSVQFIASSLTCGVIAFLLGMRWWKKTRNDGVKTVMSSCKVERTFRIRDYNMSVRISIATGWIEAPPRTREIYRM
jgi:hypothetical protein